MKIRLVAALAAVLCTAGSLFAQDLTGTWQGTLAPPGPPPLRIVFKLAKAADGKFTGQAFSIDQGAGVIPVNEITLDGRTVKMKIDAIRGSYEGTFGTDGNVVTGTFTQGAPLPLVLTRATSSTAWAIPEPPPPPKPMDPKADPGIEVATVKPAPPEARGRLYTVRGTQVMALNVTVMNVITFAYDLHERQVAGGPAWMSTEKFEIAIKPDVSGQPNILQMKKLFQKALVDRFQLKFHNEKRELSVYAITQPANTKHKLTTSSSDNNLANMIYPRPGLLPAQNATMEDLTQSLQTAVLDRPVVNQTDIQGRYNFTLDWTPDEFQFLSFGPRQGPLPDTGKPNIFQAFQDQLGLKLESTKAQANVMIVDKVEKPSDN